MDTDLQWAWQRRQSQSDPAHLGMGRRRGDVDSNHAGSRSTSRPHKPKHPDSDDTGGGAMFIIEPGNTITYSLYALLDFAKGVSIEDSYRLCDYWLVTALRAVWTWFTGLNDIASQCSRIGGRRSAGSPDRYGPGAILHHVTPPMTSTAKNDARVARVTREDVG